MSDLALTFVSACLAASLSACPNQYADPMAAESGGDKNCGTDALANIIAQRALELHQVCGGSPVKQCASIVKQPVIDKWDARLDEWERCGSGGK